MQCLFGMVLFLNSLLARSKTNRGAEPLAIIACCTALLAGAKWAIPFPNVEIITALLVIFAIYLKWWESLSICLIWILVEMAIWGIGPWVLLYFIHWPLLVILSILVAKIKWWLTIPLAIFLTAFFAPLSVTIDILLTGGIASGRFWEFWIARWISGIWFFLTHIIANAILVPIVVIGLRKPMQHLIVNQSRNEKS